MSERNKELLRFYEANRINDQMKFYAGRRAQFDRATGQGLAVSTAALTHRAWAKPPQSLLPGSVTGMCWLDRLPAEITGLPTR